MYWVYVLEMQDGRLYIGQTENLEKRLFDHHNGDDAKFTKGKTFILVGSLVVDSRSSALILEKKLKVFKNPFRVKEYLRGCSPDSESGSGRGL